MITNITNYFTNLNSAGQALFVVGILLIITFIILLIVVLKPEKNKVKKIYSENPAIDSESIFEEKMKDIDNIDIDDINIENDKTRNLKSIVDELKQVESKSVPTMMDKIDAYEDEQEDTAIISIEELLKSNKPVTYVKRNLEVTQVYSNALVTEEKKEVIVEDLIIDDVSTKKEEVNEIVEEKKYTPKREIFSSVFTEDRTENGNEAFLNSLKEFRNNL